MFRTYPLVLVAVLGCGQSSVRRGAELWFAEGPHRPLPAPRCFAYSEAHRAFACVGAVSNGQELSRHVDVLGLGPPRLAWTLPADGPWETRLAGFASIDAAPRRLVPGQTMDVGAVRMHYDVQRQDGRFVGSLRVDCGTRVESLDLAGWGVGIGPNAYVTHAGVRAVAISVPHQDGERHHLNTVVIDSASCADQRAVAVLRRPH